MKDENTDISNLFDFNTSDKFKDHLLEEIDDLENFTNSYRIKSSVTKKDDGFEDYEIPMEDCEQSHQDYEDIKEEYNNDFELNGFSQQDFDNDMKFPTTSNPNTKNFNLTSKQNLQVVTKGSAMYQKYDILTRIEKRFGKGNRILKTSTNADNYLDPASWNIDKRKMRLIAGIKNINKKAPNKNDKNNKTSNKLEFDWDSIKEMKPSDFFKTAKGSKKNLYIKPTNDMDILLVKNRNMKGIDFNIKADRFMKLFARQVEPPKFFEYNEEENENVEGKNIFFKF